MEVVAIAVEDSTRDRILIEAERFTIALEAGTLRMGRWNRRPVDCCRCGKGCDGPGQARQLFLGRGEYVGFMCEGCGGILVQQGEK